MANNFAIELSREIDVLEEHINDVWKSAVITLFSRVIIGTPVDTGFARSGWRVGETVDEFLPAPIEGEAVGTRPAPTIEFNEIPDVGGVVYLFTNVDYTQYLEEGSSPQRPNGWVANEVERWDEIVKGASRFV